MGISGFLNLFGKTKSKLCAAPIVIDSLIGEITIREAAFHACVNLIANAIANCSIKQFKNGQPVKDREWYLLNYQPNINHNATAFWQKLIHRLFEDNEALVVEVNKNLYVADAFVKNDLQALHPHTYQGVMVDNLQFDKTFSEEDVWYFKLHDADIKLLSDQVANLYAKLIQAFTNAYVSSKGSKGILYIDQIAERDYNDRFSAIAGETFKSFYENANAIVPLFEGYKYEQVQNESAPVGDPSQMRSQVEAIFETYAMAFGIPKNLITGNVQDTTEAIEFFLTFTLDPLVKLLEAEINRKLFGEKVKDGTFIRFKTNEIKHIDILTVATNIEKLISSGAMTINEVRKATGMDKIDEEFANKFFMTKNFAEIDDLLRSLERRKDDETGNDETFESS